MNHTESIYITVDRRKDSGQLQMSIHDSSVGYRLCGPKYAGTSIELLRHEITQRDADEIRSYLDKAFPSPSIAKATGKGDGR